MNLLPIGKLVELNHFIGAVESEVLLPLYHSTVLRPFVHYRCFYNNYCCKRAFDIQGIVVGAAITTHDICTIDYYGYVKKSFGLLHADNDLSAAPTLMFHEIPNDLLRTHLKTKNIAIKLPYYRELLIRLLHGEKAVHEYKYCVGKKVKRPRKAGSFRGITDFGD